MAKASLRTVICRARALGRYSVAICLFSVLTVGCQGHVDGDTNQNADLNSLVLSQATLTPSFDPSVTSYAASVSGSGESVTVTATAAEEGATIQVQNIPVVSGATSDPIPLRPALKTITVNVTAPDGTTQKSYMLVVQLMGWQLNETNTGLAGAGIDKNSLEEYTGPSTPEYGTVISLKKITTPLWLINGNITVDRCWFQPTSKFAEGLISTYNVNDGWTPAPATSYIYDSDLDGTALSAEDTSKMCAVRGLADVKRCNIYGMGTGIAIFSYALTADCVVENNYVHDLRAYGDPATTGSHNESATIRSYLGNSLIWKNNRFIDKTGNDSGALFVQPYSTNIQHVLVEGNLLESYNFCLFIMNYGSNTYSDFKVNNNRFVEGGFGPVCVNDGDGFAEWSENYYDDPTDSDRKGESIPNP